MERVRRDDPTVGLTFREPTGCGASFFSVKYNWKKEVKLIEVFCGSSSKGGCTSNTKVVGRLTSGLLQHDAPIDFILDQLESEVCSAARYRAGRDEEFRKTGNHSCSKALASAIRKGLKFAEFLKEHKNELTDMFKSTPNSDGEMEFDVDKKDLEDSFPKREKPTPTILPSPLQPQGDGDLTCPECGKDLTNEGGCKVCKDCGWSKC